MLVVIALKVLAHRKTNTAMENNHGYCLNNIQTRKESLGWNLVSSSCQNRFSLQVCPDR